MAKTATVTTSQAIRQSFTWDIYADAADEIRERLIGTLGKERGGAIWYAYVGAVSDAARDGDIYASDAKRLAEDLITDATHVDTHGRNDRFNFTGGITHTVAGVEARRMAFLSARHRAYDLETAIKSVLGIETPGDN